MSAEIKIDVIQFKRGTTAKLNAMTQIPAAGEPIFDIELTKLKIGDGIHTYADLQYVGGDGKTQIIFASRYEFPNVGEEDMLYIAKDESNAYLWTGTHYELVSVDHNEINGGSADSF